MGHSTRDGRLFTAWEKEVPQGCIAVMFKGVEVVFSTGKLIKLHELVCRSFDEESPNKLMKELVIKGPQQSYYPYIDHSINHQVPISEH